MAKSLNVLVTLLVITVAFIDSYQSRKCSAQTRQPANISPVMEIEVLSPKVDPLDNPAIFASSGKVDIPPVLMVHRYYYSGDRSFQGPMLPGGPSILVANHPQTGKRVYIPAQMMPGSPRVTYTKKAITYDYGKNGISLHFGARGKASIKYRSGFTTKQKLDRITHAEHFKDSLNKISDCSKELFQRQKTVAIGMTADIKESSKVITIPVINVLQSLPFGKILFSGDMERYYAERAAQFKQEIRSKRGIKKSKLNDLSIKTNR